MFKNESSLKLRSTPKDSIEIYFVFFSSSIVFSVHF
jgi:hypothetical protein